MTVYRSGPVGLMYELVCIPLYTSWIVGRGIVVSGVDLFPGYGVCALQYSRGRVQGLRVFRL